MSAFEHKKFFEEHVEDGATFPKMSEMQKYAMRNKIYHKYKWISVYLYMYIYVFSLFMSLNKFCYEETNNFTRSDLYIWKEFVCVHTFRARNLHLLRHRRITDYLLTRF